MTCGSAPRVAGTGEHAVRFYRADGELADAVGGYLAEGVRSGDGVIAVTTTRHWLAFEAALAEAGVDVARERGAGRLLVEDAAKLPGRFLVGDGIDQERFRAVLGGLVRRAAAGGRPVRVYGEMVAEFWAAGQVNLAIELEALWNGLGSLLPFALLCGYPASMLDSADTADAVREVCGLHSDVIAAESVCAADYGAGPFVRTRSFVGELDSVRRARHFAVGLLDGGSGGAPADDAAFIVTELASNAVLHARSGFTLTVSRSAAVVRIAVRDSGSLAPRNDALPFDVRAGHGLSVVA